MKFDDFKASTMTGANQVRVVTMTEDDIHLRAREGLIFAHPHMPALIRRLVRRGSLDFLVAGTRQALRDIEKPADLLTHESRAAWVLAMHRPLMEGLDERAKAVVAQVAVTSIRVGNKDFTPPPHAVIHAGFFGPVFLALVGIALAIGAIVVAF